MNEIGMKLETLGMNLCEFGGLEVMNLPHPFEERRIAEMEFWFEGKKWRQMREYIEKNCLLNE